MCMTLHLDGDNFICQCSDQSYIAVKQDCKHMTGILSLIYFLNFKKIKQWFLLVTSDLAGRGRKKVVNMFLGLR